MKLVIAEKPSVAQSLAAVIGATARKDGYLEGGGWRVSWCVGHLAGLADADAYNPDYAKWRYDDLPILPEPWQMVVSKDKKKQFDVLKQLMNAPDVTEVVNACDAGREGELIFRSVYELAGCQKPMKRLWISSMEDSAIREGFANLRPGADYDGLRDAALCRAKADWLVVSMPPGCFPCCTTGPSTSDVSCPRRWPSLSSEKPRSTPSSRCHSTRSHWSCPVSPFPGSAWQTRLPPNS